MKNIESPTICDYLEIGRMYTYISKYTILQNFKRTILMNLEILV